MKITALTVEYEDGTVRTWTGDVGYVRVLNVQKIGKPYQRRVTASLLLPEQKDVKG